MDEIKIDVTKEIERFERHLNPPGNNHVLISGILGIGKTCFLNEFFKVHKKYEIVINVIFNKNVFG